MHVYIHRERVRVQFTWNKTVTYIILLFRYIIIVSLTSKSWNVSVPLLELIFITGISPGSNVSMVL